MYATFTELKEKREALLKAQQMNEGFKDGIQNLLDYVSKLPRQTKLCKPA